MTDKYQNKYRIPSARLQTWDYGSNAAYFITICTQNREHFFGEILGNEPAMKLNELGKLANQFWLDIPQHFPFVLLDSFIVMPNHVHGIILINKPDNVDNIDNIDIIENVETRQCLVSTNPTNPTTFIPTNPTTPEPTNPTNPEPTTPELIIPESAILPAPEKTFGQKRFQNQGKNTLSSIIGSYKSVTTKFARQIQADFAWQTRFHDHIIRNPESFERIRNYIQQNPFNWAEDTFYS